MSKEKKTFDVETIRHSAAHVLAQAVMQMFPEAKLGIGPTIDDGFYYDFELPRPLIPEDLAIIEKKMKQITKQRQKFIRKEEDSAEALRFLEESEQVFKAELVKELIEKGEDITFYENVMANDGKSMFVDMCRGPHVENTGEIGHFKLMKIAGAYWRGDEKNPMLQRIYGVAFKEKADLDAYLKRLKEAKKRDHRVLGAKLDLFTFSDKVGSGLPLFTPKGTFIRNKIEETIMAIQAEHGFERVCIPHITKKDLYETSGHWAKFKDDLFHVHGKGDTEFVMKPMNCPHHTQIYASKMRSYRDLPIRYAETTTCYRDEQAGELLGISRVRSLTQDDGHIFCTVEQIKAESKNIVDVIRQFYTKLDMFKEGDYKVSLSVRDPKKPEKYLGDTANWDKAEAFLKEIADEENLPYERVEGEAAFYGPKLDFQFKDSLGREWQLATIQIDFVQPERFELEYTNSDGGKSTPVMIHRAVAGSLERFMAVMIEHYAGAFPAWLAPVQVAVLPVIEKFADYAQEVCAILKTAGVRFEADYSNDNLGKKIRNAEMQRLPYMIVVGETEVTNKTITVRDYATKDQVEMSVEEFVKMLSSK